MPAPLHTQRPFSKRAGYVFLRALARLCAVVLFRYRCHGRERIPASGSVLVCANHQSLLDPVVVGMCFQRRLNYLARKTLFRFFALRWLINYLDAIPIDRDGVGLEGIRATLGRLKRGEMVLMFPEGTRTRDGNLGPLKPGFCALARRGRTALLPVGFDGAFDAWPRSSLLPQPTRISVAIGQPIDAEHIARLSDTQLIDELQRRMSACFADARRRRLSQARSKESGARSIGRIPVRSPDR
jgi:1-acyl-sn-glycerol-3-phosphate acyltransferase